MNILDYHEHKGAFDSVFAVQFLDEGDTESLATLKASAPGQRVTAPDGRIGYLPAAAEPVIEHDIERLIAERRQRKAARDFAGADAIRQRLERWGYALRDDRGGTGWIFKTPTRTPKP